jgi:PPOX class probable F420-dependent enzyme
MSIIPASHRDLIESSQVVILATNGSNGTPQVTATWFAADDDGTVNLSINTKRQKARNLQRDPKCTLFFIDPANPYRTLEIRGRAETVPDTGYALAKRVGAKYGADLSQMDAEGDTRLAVTIVPTRVNTYG